MRYVETHTSIPIPHIHLVEYDAQNCVGTRFILMDKVGLYEQLLGRILTCVDRRFHPYRGLGCLYI